MKTNKLIYNAFTIILFFIISSCESKYYPNISTTKSPLGTEVYKPDSASIAQHYVIPQWYKDAKFGIFIHWGVYTVPAYGSEWYARWMYKEGSAINKYHVKTYGPLTKFGYKDFIPMFKAPKFNAKEWAKIFKASGAQYVVPVAEHHDGFEMYNSSWNKWNSVNMGPHIDVIGELKKSVTAAGLHFGLSSHRCENAWFYEFGKDTPSDVQDSSISLYGERLHQPEGEGMTAYCGKYPGSNERSRKQWLMSTYELIDKYKPELFWFDWTVGKYPFQPTFYKFLAYYYNNAIDWNKQVVVNTKFGYGDNIQVLDIERGKSDKIRKYPWQTDTSIGKKSWSYCVGEINKSPDHIIDDFVDIVSKNGNLLLNIGPRLDGSITEEQQNVLMEMGKWLKVNGEAIYKSKPWVISEEGITKGTSGYMTDNTKTNYTAQDIRFTTRNNNLYAISLAWTEGKIVIKSLGKQYVKDLVIKNVTMLGSSEKLDWKLTNDGLEVSFPKKKTTHYAHIFKIELSGIVCSKPYLKVGEVNTVSTIRIFNHNDNDVVVDLTSILGSVSKKSKIKILAKSCVSCDVNYDFAKTKNNHYTLFLDDSKVFFQK